MALGAGDPKGDALVAPNGDALTLVAKGFGFTLPLTGPPNGDAPMDAPMDGVLVATNGDDVTLVAKGFELI